MQLAVTALTFTGIRSWAPPATDPTGGSAMANVAPTREPAKRALCGAIFAWETSAAVRGRAASEMAALAGEEEAGGGRSRDVTAARVSRRLAIG
ncbi:unnamed protein product [Lampetra planeri]